MKISCVTASYVVDLLGYPGEMDWELASKTITSFQYRGEPHSSGSRSSRSPMLEVIDGIIDRLAPAGLDGIEFWYPHVWPANITPALASEIRRRLAARGMVCCACAGSVEDPGEDPYGCEELFQTACLLGAPLIAGHMEAHSVPQLGALCARYGVCVAYENGAEKDASQILAIIQDSGEWIGANIDTGNLAAQGGDPVRAVRELGERIVHVHFKDVPAVGSHECVALGEGIVDVAGVIRELRSCGYDGWLSIEIETSDHDPTDEILESAETVRRLWGRS
jgi:sugar phosphate isomerase/epimerase